MIKAKIMKNNAKGTNEDFITFCRFVLGTTVTFIVDEGGNSVVQVRKALSLFEKSLITYTFAGLDYDYTYAPIPLGVGVGVIDGVDGDLGFLNTPGARGMITLTAPSIGGVFADVNA